MSVLCRTRVENNRCILWLELPEQAMEVWGWHCICIQTHIIHPCTHFIVNCGAPLTPSDNRITTIYNSTLEGSLLELGCGNVATSVLYAHLVKCGSQIPICTRANLLPMIHQVAMIFIHTGYINHYGVRNIF